MAKNQLYQHSNGARSGVSKVCLWYTSNTLCRVFATEFKRETGSCVKKKKTEQKKYMFDFEMLVSDIKQVCQKGKNRQNTVFTRISAALD